MWVFQQLRWLGPFDQKSSLCSYFQWKDNFFWPFYALSFTTHAQLQEHFIINSKPFLVHNKMKANSSLYVYFFQHRSGNIFRLLQKTYWRAVRTKMRFAIAKNSKKGRFLKWGLETERIIVSKDRISRNKSHSEDKNSNSFFLPLLFLRRRSSSW